jgi:hypothetical protein
MGCAELARLLSRIDLVLHIYIQDRSTPILWGVYIIKNEINNNNKMNHNFKRNIMLNNNNNVPFKNIKIA